MNGRSRREYLAVIYARYRRAGLQEKQVILSEFCRNTGYNRKYAIRLLNGPPPNPRRESPRPRHRLASYSKAVIAVLGAVWEAAGYPCAVRLKALLPLWMPWVRKRFRPTPATESDLLRISARQMDRRLEERKKRVRHRLYGGTGGTRTKPGTLLKHLIPLRTDHWQEKMPGFAEVDLVSHSGNSASGEFAYSLNLTDVHTGWTETRAILGKGRQAVLDALEEIQAALPFPLRGINSDNGTEFINWHVGVWCARHEVQFSHSRPYKKDDNAYIEQKNWTHVRKLTGWDRYDTPEAVAALNDLYRNELRRWLNLFQPSAKLIKKVRAGSKLRRRYDLPRTPLDRLDADLENGQADEATIRSQLAALKKLRQGLDPFELSRQIDRKLQGIYALAHTRPIPRAPLKRQSGRITF
jgi:transposase InsO family protein